ncbi:MAG: UbiA family prenyltransferase [Actinobacteria bacterium]|nr:UbiA family prenyltransferase [Actinomycetota bacterium]
MTTPAGTAVSITRAEKWWASKISPLLAAAYLSLLIAPRTAEAAIGRLVLLVLSACFLATAAYVVNDWYDRESDRALGKESTTARLGGPVVFALLVGLWAAGIVPWFFAGLPGPAWGALAAITLMPLVYSAPPIRWKERGALGLVADATLAHLAPTVFALACFGALDGADAGPAGLVASAGAVVWSLTAGLRMIIGHELVDADNDRASGLTTWVIDVGEPRATAVARAIVVVEVGALAAVAGSLWWLSRAAFIAVVVVVVALAIARITKAWTQPLTAAPGGDDGRAMLFPFYRFWPPILLLVGLVADDPAYALIALVHLGLFWTVTIEEVVGLAGFAREHLVTGLGRWLRFQLWPWITETVPNWMRNRVWAGITTDIPNWFRHRFWPWLTEGIPKWFRYRFVPFFTGTIPNWFRYRLKPWFTGTAPNWFRYRLPEAMRSLRRRIGGFVQRARRSLARRVRGGSTPPAATSGTGNVPPTKDPEGGTARGDR